MNKGENFERLVAIGHLWRDTSGFSRVLVPNGCLAGAGRACVARNSIQENHRLVNSQFRIGDRFLPLEEKGQR